MQNDALFFKVKPNISGNYAGYIYDISGVEHALIVGVFSFFSGGTGNADMIWNIAGKTHESRLCVPKMSEFRYHIDDYGFVHLTMKDTINMYFAITRCRQIDESKLIALELDGISDRDVTDRSNIMLSNLKRIPDDVRYTESTINGFYAGHGSGLGGLRAATAHYFMFNGDGTGTDKSIWNLPSTDNLSKRQIYHESSNVNYIIDASGIGRVQIKQGDGQQFEAWFVVTKIIRQNNMYIASEVYGMQTELEPISGSLISGYLQLVDLDEF